MGNKNELWRAIVSKKMLICFANGLSAGMPLFFLVHYLPAWLRTSGVDLKTIGLFALIGIPYTWKFLWSPLMDAVSLPFLGRRRGWMLVSQLAIMFSMLAFSFLDPQSSLWAIAYLGLALAFFSSCQDIVLDAYRRELLDDEELGLGNAFYINGYRAAVFIPGGLGLILADYIPWQWAHPIIAAFMMIGIGKTLLIKELPVISANHGPSTFSQAVIGPFQEFFQRDGVKQGLLVLAFMFFYKLGDNMATALSTPFFLDLGFSKTIIGTMVKMVNFWSMIAGSMLGGIFIYKIGINRALWIFGVIQMVTILGFAILNELGPILWVLGVVLGLEYFGVGLGAAAMTAFISRSAARNFTATQLALFTSLIALPRTFANAITGFLIEGIGPADGLFFRWFGLIDGMGYTNFFLFCTLCALPGMLLLPAVAPWNLPSEKHLTQSTN